MHFYTFKALARALLLPPMGLLILAILGAVLIALNHRRSGWSCLLAGLAAMWVLSMQVVADELTRLTQVYPAFDSAKPTHAQAIVILGGVGERTFAPEYPGIQFAASLELLERVNYGAWLSRTTHLPILVTSIGENTRTMVASLSRDFQVRPRWVDYKSHDTFENARNSALLLRADNVHSILLVTSDTHMLRATREFLGTGLQVTPAPVHVLPRHIYYDVFCYLPSADAMMYSNRAIYELVGERVREILVALNVRRQQPG
ncbi:MAG TPA: YdcF family protein [Steroidobacteraceae bacterium]